MTIQACHCMETQLGILATQSSEKELPMNGTLLITEAPALNHCHGIIFCNLPNLALSTQMLQIEMLHAKTTLESDMLY